MPFISHYPCLPQAGPKALKGRSMPGSISSEDSNQPKILDEVRQYLRLHHYSIHTERSYVDWIVRFIHFHRMRSREDLLPGEPKIEAFLTHLAVEGNVATATQNQAMNALVFLYKRVSASIQLNGNAESILIQSSFTQNVWHKRLPKPAQKSTQPDAQRSVSLSFSFRLSIPLLKGKTWPRESSERIRPEKNA